MRILILGGSGMLGHRLWLTARGHHETSATVREATSDLSTRLGLPASELVTAVDASRFESVTRALAQVRPQVVVNCVGIVKQRPEAKDPIASITINALFPHRLAELCRASGTRLIHISTDCVFNGRRGNYSEADQSDAEDLYGRSKYLGEVSGPGALTLRTSIIGRELKSGHGLVEWFLAQPGPAVTGFTQALFSGLTTLELSRVIVDVAERFPALAGLYQVGAEPIAKADLLDLLNREFDRGWRIDRAEEPRIDRTLDSRRFREATCWTPPAWAEMVAELARDTRISYSNLRR